MNNSSDFRKLARESLNSKWGDAILAGLIATILGGANTNGISFKTDIKTDGASINLKSIISTEGIELIKTVLPIIIISILVYSIAFLLFGSIIKTGYYRFNINLTNNMDTSIGMLFSYFKHWKNIICTFLLSTLYIAASFLLLIIPGIIATYTYAMTSYILADNPELSASEVLSLSKQMMTGNRFRLFCLQFSFIGWDLLCALTLGIGSLWLVPYKNAAYAHFYHEVSQNINIYNQ